MDVKAIWAGKRGGWKEGSRRCSRKGVPDRGKSLGKRQRRMKGLSAFRKPVVNHD